MQDLNPKLGSKYKTGSLLVKLRKSINLTQKDIASRFQVSAQAVSKWERGENLPDSKLLLSISRFYNITVDELLVGSLRKKTERNRSDSIQVFLGSFLFFISMIMRIELLIPKTPINDAISILFMSFSVLLLLLVKRVRLISLCVRKQAILLISGVIIYFSINYLFNLWEYTWIIFIIVLKLDIIINKKED